jgi:L-iditol 2-dehydrogenase
MKNTMRVAICTDAGHVEIQSRPLPLPGPSQILLKISVCGICGTDVGIWRGTVPHAFPYSAGHEFCGVIQRVGAEVHGFRPGDTVVINPNLGCGECRLCRAGRPNLCDALKTRPLKSNGGLAEYTAVDADIVYRLPQALPDGLAPFIEPFSCALHAVRVAALTPSERVAVLGAGAMGVLTALAAVHETSDLCIIEPSEERRDQARRATGLRTLAPVELADPEWADRFDVILECSGATEAASRAARCLRKGGRLVLTGLAAQAIPLDAVVQKELTLQGAWLNPNTFEQAIAATCRHLDAIASLETKTLSLELRFRESTEARTLPCNVSVTPWRECHAVLPFHVFSVNAVQHSDQ